MSVLKFSVITIGLIGSMASSAFAYDSSSINRTQANQVHSIDQLRRTGQLTRREYNALMAEQARIAALEQHAQSDGYISGREYRSIRGAQQAAGSHIYQESTDGQVNYWRRWKAKHGIGY